MEERKQCFTSIQSRKLLGHLESCNLCPSMDLVVYSTSAASQQQNLYRTVSWQKLATIAPEQHDAEEAPPAPGATCWSPSGRWIVVAHDTLVSLYGAEPLANPPGGSGFGAVSNEAQYSWRCQHPVTGLSWAHVGRAHPTAWASREEEEEQETSWSYQSQYIDQASVFLPPSGYLQPGDEEDHHRHHEHTTTTALPECKTPLSLLCVSTAQSLEVYVHGRYPLLTLDHHAPEGASPPNVAVSNDLSCFLVQAGPKLALYHLPFLKRDRYPLQIVASLHASIMSHLSTLQQSVTEIANAWKSSLKPLDTKLQPLLRLLKNYGVDDQPIGVILKQYILVGHTSESSSVANAMDQFFTSIQLNDQLLQRMERSLHGALANVESQARKGLLSPTQALCYDVQELLGHVRFHSVGEQQAGPLEDLDNASQHLWGSVEALMLSIVEARFRTRDFCGWLRSAGSQVKARGTASNSVQRENAKKRRVPQAVVERLLAAIHTQPAAGKIEGSLSEHLLGLSVVNKLKSVFEESKPRPASPVSVVTLDSPIPTVAHAVEDTLGAAKAVFVNPLSNIPEVLVPTEFFLPQLAGNTPSSVATHTRVGRDPSLDETWRDEEEEEEEEPTYFLPRACSGEDPDTVDTVNCRQWGLLVQSHSNMVQLFAIPLGYRDAEDIDVWDNDDGYENDPPEFYLTATMELPDGGVVRDVGFYSDDGKSSLSSGNDSGTGKEGRQKLGLLVEESGQLDLWLVAYDTLLWQSTPFDANLVDATRVQASSSFVLRPMRADEADEEDSADPCCLDVQTRTVGTLESDDTEVRLLLSGSRGVGAAAMSHSNVTTVELLDLEEDEEDEDFDEDEE